MPDSTNASSQTNMAQLTPREQTLPFTCIQLSSFTQKKSKWRVAMLPRWNVLPKGSLLLKCLGQKTREANFLPLVKDESVTTIFPVAKYEGFFVNINSCFKHSVFFWRTVEQSWTVSSFEKLNLLTWAPILARPQILPERFPGILPYQFWRLPSTILDNFQFNGF